VRIGDDDNVITKQNFKVEEYVLPRFEVIVDTKSHVTLEQKIIRLTVSANYTFGESVKGKALITARVYDTEYPDNVQNTYSKTVYDIFYKQKTEFRIKEDLGINHNIRPFKVEFNVAFVEALTGQTLEKNATVKVQANDDVAIEIRKFKNKFIPGFVYKIQTVAFKFDGSFVTSTITPVELHVKFYATPLMCSSKEKATSLVSTFELNAEQIPKNGYTNFDLAIPKNVTDVSITARYLFAEASLNVTRVVSNTREYIYARVKTK
jgi:hypothetical protein